jgi:glyoxylase-like metal-dependent hydrolase (beta-lactamase superfamily II)
MAHKEGWMAVKSLQVLFLGQDNDMPRRLLAYGAAEGQLVTTCFLSFLIRAEDMNILFDAGMHCEVATHLKSQGRPISVREEDCLPARLKEAAGLTLADIDMVILSHVHRDHTGWLGEFPKAEVVCQKDDYTAAVIEPAPYFNPLTPQKKYSERPIWWRLIDGDQEIVPGLTVFLTPGHTRGHQALLVQLPESGPMLLVGDAVLDLACLEKEIIPGIYDNRIDALRSLRKIKALAKVTGARVIPTHDMETMHCIKKSPEAYT